MCNRKFLSLNTNFTFVKENANWEYVAQKEEVKAGVKHREANMTSICSFPVFHKNCVLKYTKSCEPTATVNSI